MYKTKDEQRIKIDKFEKYLGKKIDEQTKAVIYMIMELENKAYEQGRKCGSVIKECKLF